MAETERVEGAREKGDLFGILDGEGPDLQLVVADKAVQMLQHCRVVEKIQFIFSLRFIQGQNALAAVAEQIIFFSKAEFGRAEEIHADAPERLLTDGIIVIGKTAHDQAQDLVFASVARCGAFLCAEQALIAVVML